MRYPKLSAKIRGVFEGSYSWSITAALWTCSKNAVLDDESESAKMTINAADRRAYDSSMQYFSGAYLSCQETLSKSI